MPYSYARHYSETVQWHTPYMPTLYSAVPLSIRYLTLLLISQHDFATVWWSRSLHPIYRPLRLLFPQLHYFGIRLPCRGLHYSAALDCSYFLPDKVSPRHSGCRLLSEFLVLSLMNVPPLRPFLYTPLFLDTVDGISLSSVSFSESTSVFNSPNSSSSSNSRWYPCHT